MTINLNHILACPLDGLPLTVSGKALACASGHNYDTARNGYCNLLLVQQKASIDPGDSTEMVAARRRFLNAGYFVGIAERVFFLAQSVLRSSQSVQSHILDAGCGEGFYLERFALLAQQQEQPLKVALGGIDVSKWAVKAAASRDLRATWVVASNRKPPFLPGSIDMILSIFGFPHWNGFAGILAKGGHVLLGDPGSEHLLELRRIIYPIIRPSTLPTLSAAEQAGFSLIKEERVHYSIELEGQEMIQDLLLMTPHGVHVSPERRVLLADLERLSVTIDVTLRLLKL